MSNEWTCAEELRKEGKWVVCSTVNTHSADKCSSCGEYKPAVCEACDGEGSVGCDSCACSGEGMVDGSRCSSCMGRGIVPCGCDNDYADRDCYIDMKIDELRMARMMGEEY